MDNVTRCAINNLKTDLSFLDNVNPIPDEEFITRRDKLAKALAANNVDAFVLEPGYTFQYYGNISQPDWEPWEPEERPFLMVILPRVTEDGTITAKTAFLAPHFEEGRVRMLGIPSREPESTGTLTRPSYPPRSSKESKAQHSWSTKIRDYIARGLQTAGFKTVGLSPEAELVR